MTERIKKDDVYSAFNSFRGTATRLGFDVKGWALIESDLGQPWSLVKKEIVAVRGSRIDSTEFPRYLGNTTRQAYDKLVSYTQALHAVEIMQKNGSN